MNQGDIEIGHHFGGALGFRSKDQLDAVADGDLSRRLFICFSYRTKSQRKDGPLL